MDPEKIFFFDIEQDTRFAFSMCNPPFYSSQEEIEQGLLNKELEPSAVRMLMMIKPKTIAYEQVFFYRFALVQAMK